MTNSSNEKLKIKCLLGLWGEKYIYDFLHYSLPSLLAEGNLPALAKEAELTFVFLTRSKDIPVFTKEPAFSYLESICKIEFMSITDLIVHGNYSTTLTLAYDRAIRHDGDQMLETYYIFLTSDYIMANGSMRGLLKYIHQGFSGICAGNYQVIEEQVTSILNQRIDQKLHVLEIEPRELVDLSLGYLHPVTMASFYSVGVTHNYQANRFFMRYDENTIAGRFYLLHMLCIKPETTSYRVGSSCDYSFIPEMCPSGNVAVITDSDDYLVVEMQPEKHELSFVQWGEYESKKLVFALSEWATQNHRDNSSHTIIYHSKDLKDSDREKIEVSLSQFVGPVNKQLTKYKPKPHYMHPYWIGAAKVFNKREKVFDNTRDFEYPDLDDVYSYTPFKTAYNVIFGEPPSVYRWHYKWNSFRLLKQVISRNVKAYDPSKVAVVYESLHIDFLHYKDWMKDELGISRHYNKNIFESDESMNALRDVEYCILMVCINDISKTNKTINHIFSKIKKNSHILVLIPNARDYLSKYAYDFPVIAARKFGPIIEANKCNIVKIEQVKDRLTLLGNAMFDRINKIFSYSKSARLSVYALMSIPAFIYNTLRNCLPKFMISHGHCTDLFFTLSKGESQCSVTEND